MAQKDPLRNGEMYRLIADTGGAFVQPALYEAFGLTVVEVSLSPAELKMVPRAFCVPSGALCITQSLMAP